MLEHFEKVTFGNQSFSESVVQSPEMSDCKQTQLSFDLPVHTGDLCFQCDSGWWSYTDLFFGIFALGCFCYCLVNHYYLNLLFRRCTSEAVTAKLRPDAVLDPTVIMWRNATHAGGVCRYQQNHHWRQEIGFQAHYHPHLKSSSL